MSIDVKIDDGMPNSGKTLGHGMGYCKTGSSATADRYYTNGDGRGCNLAIEFVKQ